MSKKQKLTSSMKRITKFSRTNTKTRCTFHHAAAKSLQSCLTLCDPIDGSPPGSSPSLGFSRQEHWSGLPFPSPMHESEKWKWHRSVVSDSVQPHRRQPTRVPVPGILQARTLEWVAISFSNAWKWKVKVTSLSRVWLLATPWTAAYHAPPSMGFSRQEYWSGVPLPSMLRVCFTHHCINCLSCCLEHNWEPIYNCGYFLNQFMLVTEAYPQSKISTKKCDECQQVNRR